MKIIPEILNAIPLHHYKLFVEFADGVKGEISLSKWVGKGVFSLWNDENNFKNFFITNDKKLQWNAEIDMDPDVFYLQLINKTFNQYAGDQQLYGILIKMYFGDHVPPYFHAEYGEYIAQISIMDFGIITGYLLPNALALVVEWANIHQQELLINWQNLSENGKGNFDKIDPLR